MASLFQWYWEEEENQEDGEDNARVPAQCYYCGVLMNPVTIERDMIELFPSCWHRTWCREVRHLRRRLESPPRAESKKPEAEEPKKPEAEEPKQDRPDPEPSSELLTDEQLEAMLD